MLLLPHLKGLRGVSGVVKCPVKGDVQREAACLLHQTANLQREGGWGRREGVRKGAGARHTP